MCAPKFFGRFLLVALVAVSIFSFSQATTVEASVDASIEAQYGCPYPVNLLPGTSGYVLPGLPNALRNAPGTSGASTVIGEIPGNGWFSVVGGPSCVDGYNWWLVEYNGVRGWTADAERNGVPWVSPFFCADGLYTRLKPNSLARVLPGEPNNIRNQPNGTPHAQIPAGATFNVIGGPSCGIYGHPWWQVSYNGAVGWTGEGYNPVYWLEPVTSYVPPPTPTPPPAGSVCNLSPRLQIGTTGMVIPGLPNALRDRPGLNISGSRVIGSLAGGAIFTILDGPVCADGHNWWRVSAGGQIGWTAEGQGYAEYWLDPVVCANGMVSRMAPGMTARVTPGLPNRLRTSPNTSTGWIMGRIPGGAAFSVLNNFSCDAQGRMWWLVNYRGLVGWTMEGQNGEYYLAPA